MKKITLILIAAALFGCKGAENNTPESGGSIGNIDVPKERNYTPSELVIGRRICAALKHKRELFERVTDMQEQFRFRGEIKNCGNPNASVNSEFTAAISNVSSNGFEYVATTNRPNYFKDVVTDQNGAMKALCESLAVSDTVSNTMLNGSSYLTVNLLISESYDRFEVAKRSKDSAGNYKLISTEGVSVITQSNQADPKFFGVEKVRQRNSTCPNSTDYSAVRQTWVSALTSF